MNSSDFPETHMNHAALAGDALRPPRIRTVAIGLFRRGDGILVAEGHDQIKGEIFYRPLGGSIEFGERGHEALAREMREEVGLEIANTRYLLTVENIFTYMGEMGHEIVLVYDGEFVDSSVYDMPELVGIEGDIEFRAMWKRLDEFGPGAPLYPDRLREYLVSQMES